MVIHQNEDDYFCLTDMLKAKDGNFFILDWLRNRNTLEYIGIWEKVYNPKFNYGEFALIKNQSELTPQQKSFVYADETDMLNVAMFGMTAREWRDTNPDLKGNIRDYATINQLICSGTE